MKITELKNKSSLTRKVVLYSEKYLNGDTWYRVDVINIDKRGYETLKYQMPFRNHKAAEHYLEIALKE